MRSLRTKLLLSHFILTLLGALAFGVTGYLLLHRQLEAAESEKLQAIADLVAMETETFLLGKQQGLARIAESREVHEFAAHNRAQTLTGYLATHNYQFPALSYWNANDVLEVAVRNGATDRDRPMFPNHTLQGRARERSGEVQVGEIFRGRDDVTWVLPLALGIRTHDRGAFAGTLYGEFSLRELSARFNTIVVGKSGHVVLLDADGTVLLISNLDADFGALGLDGKALQTYHRHGENTARHVYFADEDVLATTAVIASNGWRVEALLPYEEFAARPNRLRNQYLLILVGVAGCGALLAFFLANRIGGPLLSLAAASRAVADGRFEAIPPVRTRDELGELVDSFNRMIHELQTTTVGRDQLDNIFGSMHDALFVVGGDGRIRMANRACCELFNLSRESISGQLFDEAFGNRLLAFDCFAVLQQLEDQSVFETVLHGNDGRQQPVIIAVSSLLEPGGTARGLVCLVQDISERKASEEKIRNARNFLETVLNSMGDAISIVDAKSLVIVGANQVFLDRAGHSEAEVVGQTCYAMALHDCLPERRTPDGCPVLRTAASGVAAQGEYEHRNADGEAIYVGVKTSPIKGEDGTVTAVVHVARDISERKRAEQELQAFAAKLEQSNRELTDFAYIASHDLQEPLRKVTAFGDRLKSKYAEVLGEQGLDYLERMRHAAVRMQTLIDDLLSFSRVTTKAQPFVPVALGEIVREVLVDLEIRIQELQGVVEVGSLPTIAADPLQMRQITQNLIGNALKFHRPGVAPSIRVQGELIDDGRRCRITVADNGIGFEEQYCERIFGVFQRLHGRDEYAGSGVGLAICRKITERHHGSVTATSVPGEGTTFIVTLPVTQG